MDYAGKDTPMKRDEEFFGEQELELVYIAKRLREAQRLEGLLAGAGVDYLVEPDTYRGGFLFIRELIGAFFYVTAAQKAAAHDVLRAARLKPYQPLGEA